MPMVSRLGDSSSGHGSFPPKSSTAASPDCNINGIPAHRQGDAWAPHGSPSPSAPHGSSASGGSGTVNLNNKPLARIGDPISCGCAIVGGSSDVNCGG